MFRMKIAWKLFLTYTGVGIICVITIAIFGTRILKDYSLKGINDHFIKRDAWLVKELIKKDVLEGNLAKINERTKTLGEKIAARITIIDKDGTVLGDSEKNLDVIENLADQPEVKESLLGKCGKSIRYSNTLKIDMMYISVPIIQNKQVVAVSRLSFPLTGIKGGLSYIHKIVFLGMLLGISLVLGIETIISRKITQPLQNMSTLAKKLAQGFFTQQIKIDFQDKAGELAQKKTFKVHAIPIQAEKDMFGAVAVVHDISKPKELEKMWIEFIANISHELRTPLTLIKGFTETLRTGDVTDVKDRQRFFQIIETQTERINNLIDNLLNLSNLGSKELVMQFEQVRLNDLLKKIVANFEEIIKRKKHIIKVDFPVEFPRVEVDLIKIEQVFNNLLDNAIKFMPEPGEICIKAIENQKNVCIEIVDSGMGIASEHLDRLFERFYRVDKTRSRKWGGAGLGLSIVRHIIHAHQGEVGVESKVGKGSKFFFILPKKQNKKTTLYS